MSVEEYVLILKFRNLTFSQFDTTTTGLGSVLPTLAVGPGRKGNYVIHRCTSRNYEVNINVSILPLHIFGEPVPPHDLRRFAEGLSLTSSPL